MARIVRSVNRRVRITEVRISDSLLYIIMFVVVETETVFRTLKNIDLNIHTENFKL